MFLCMCSFCDLLVTNCFKISSKQFKKIQHGIRATLKGDTAQLGFVFLNKSLDRSTRKEGSSNSSLKGASFYGDKTKIQIFLILDVLLFPGQTRVSFFQGFIINLRKRKIQNTSPQEDAYFPPIDSTCDPSCKIRVSTPNPTTSRRRWVKSCFLQVSIHLSISIWGSQFSKDDKEYQARWKAWRGWKL